MDKAVIISIKPEWCKMIASVNIRKLSVIVKISISTQMEASMLSPAVNTQRKLLRAGAISSRRMIDAKWNI